MTHDHTFNKVSEIILKNVGQTKLNLNRNTLSSDVDGWGSLQHIMIISEIEETFGIKFDFMEILEMKSVGDICIAIEKQNS
ncbi:MAG: acyl carrier protein [Prolixibacteraceae bacterium]|jgi:acyl carrier protein|nr:acyl carrier protein [Prolixibacteraceae bacterium]